MFPAHSVSDYIDEDAEVGDNVDEKMPCVLLQAEDFGGVVPIPFYAFLVPR